MSEKKIYQDCLQRSEIRTFFRFLDPNPKIMFSRSILAQGRLYVFDTVLAFHSNIFGKHRVVLMSYKDIAAVVPAKTLGLPTTIRIEMKDGTAHRFASFVVRDQQAAPTLETLGPHIRKSGKRQPKPRHKRAIESSHPCRHRRRRPGAHGSVPLPSRFMSDTPPRTRPTFTLRFTLCFPPLLVSSNARARSTSSVK